MRQEGGLLASARSFLISAAWPPLSPSSSPPRGFPEGFQYNDEVLSPDQERTLVEKFASLPFREFEFRGFLGKRRTVSFGWRYDFNVRELQEAEEIPTFLLDLRETAAKFAGLPEGQLQHVLVTEYSPGAAIGWHKDRPEFNDVIGISLLTPCVFRLEAEGGATLGACVIRASASLGISPSWCRAGGTGSTASHPLTSFAIRSPSEAYVSRRNDNASSHRKR